MKGASFTSSLPTPPSSYIWACPLGDSKGVGNNEGIACSGHATIASVKPLILSDPAFFLTPHYGNIKYRCANSNNKPHNQISIYLV
jgi:hypothetical protein